MKSPQTNNTVLTREGAFLSPDIQNKPQSWPTSCRSNLKTSLCAHESQEVKLESPSQQRRQATALCQRPSCWASASQPPPDFLLLCTWTRYLSTKSNSQHRVHSHNEVLSDLCFLRRGQDESVRLTRQLIRISTEWDTTECQAYQLLNTHHTNFVIARTSARHLSATWIINKYMPPASSLGN